MVIIMRKPTIKHEHLRNVISDFKDNSTEENFEKLIGELKHSCLIMVGDENQKEFSLNYVQSQEGEFGLLFTDMDEYRKVFPDFELPTRFYDFATYANILKNIDLDGYIINIESESFAIYKEFVDLLDSMPNNNFPVKNAYDTKQLKKVKDNIDNLSLEKFIGDSNNIGKYEELFDEISKSNLLTLILSDNNLSQFEDGGVILLNESDPLGFLYIDTVGGEYATVFTSENKLKTVKTEYNKYSELVNFSQIVNFVLNDDMDGIIINPGLENIILSREVLMNYWLLIEEKCYDERLNSAIYHLFEIDEV